jgi:hypothetical protein
VMAGGPGVLLFIHSLLVAKVPPAGKEGLSTFAWRRNARLGGVFLCREGSGCKSPHGFHCEPAL